MLSKRKRIVFGVLSLLLLWGVYAIASHRISLPIAIAIQSNEERCLEANAMLLVRTQSAINRGDWVAFEPFGALSYVKVPYVIKIVAGIPGDHLAIKHGAILINGKQVASGLPDAPIFGKPERYFEKNELIPNGEYFVLATHPLSMDSRYWGYLKESQIQAHAYRLF